MSQSGGYHRLMQIARLAWVFAAAAFGSLAIGTGVRCFARPAASMPATSPTTHPVLTESLAPDMPVTWFMHESEEVARWQRPLIGQPAPAVHIGKWLQHELDLSPAATKGRVVILDIWATYCVPCMIDMPDTGRLAKQYADQGVVIASICSDGEEAEITDFIRDKQIDLPMAMDNHMQTYDAFASQFMPTYVAIDRTGIVRALGFKHEALEPIIKKLLAEPTP